jgi:hypothetical protein
MLDLINTFYIFIYTNYHYYSGVLIGLLVHINEMTITQILNFLLISTMLVAGSKKVLESFLVDEKDVLYIVIIVGIVGCKALRHFLDNYLIKIVDTISKGFLKIITTLINKLLAKIN